MNPFREKVKSIIADSLEPEKLRMEKHDERRIRGFIVSKKFEGLDEFERQAIIEKALKTKLNKTEQTKVLLFLAYTPGEYEAYSAPFETTT